MMGMGLTVVIIAFSVIIALITLGGTGFIFWKVFSKMGEASRIRQIGVPATAQILQLADTGTTINDNPQVMLTMNVQSPQFGAYQVQTTAIISRLAIPRVQPGAMVPVKIDPTNPRNVALDI